MKEITTKGSEPGIDLHMMEVLARQSGSKEMYHQISNGDDYRLGIVIKVNDEQKLDHSIELLVRVSSDMNELQVSMMEKGLVLSRELQDRGYTLTYEDEGWILYQGSVLPEMISDECSFLIHAIMEFREGGRIR